MRMETKGVWNKEHGTRNKGGEHGHGIKNGRQEWRHKIRERKKTEKREQGHGTKSERKKMRTRN